MRHVIKPSAFVLVASLVFVQAFPADVQAQQTPAPKKILFLTYPGVGAPGSHGHASLPAAEEQAVLYGKAAGFEVTTLKGYEPGVGNQDLSFFTPEYLWDPLESTCRHASLSIL